MFLFFWGLCEISPALSCFAFLFAIFKRVPRQQLPKFAFHFVAHCIYQLVFAFPLSACSSLSLSLCFLDELHRRLTFYWQLNFRNSQTCRLPLACCMLNFVFVATVPLFSLHFPFPCLLLLLLDCLFKCHLYSLKGTKNQSSDKQTLVLNWLCVFIIIITVSAFNSRSISTSSRSS